MKNENDMNLLYENWCSINNLPFQSADETLHNLDVTEEQREYLECFIHVSDVNNITLKNFNIGDRLVAANLKNYILTVNNMISQLDQDNGYDTKTHHLDMLPDHQEILFILTNLIDKLNNYQTIAECKKEKEEDTKLIKKQLNEYLNKYSSNDTATLIGELL